MSNIYSASSQYANRPADERFTSLADMIAAAVEDKNLSAERTYNLRDLRAVATPTDVRLASPLAQATLTHWSFGQLCRSVAAPAGYLRDGLSPALAADCLNYGIQQAPVGTRLNLLLRQANGNPEPIVRAATSDSYARVWDAELYGQVARVITDRDDRWQLPMTWEGTRAGAYRGDRDSFLIITNGGSIVDDPSLRGGSNAGNGQMFRGLLIRNSEVGAAAITIEQILFRFICGNHILWGAVIDRKFKRRHVGAGVLHKTAREISSIAFQWAQASTERDNAIIKGLVSLELAHTRDAVIDELQAIGATREQAIRMYDRCEATEAASPRSYWGLAQGATRASQDTTYQDERYALDKLAAAVLARGAKRVAA
jgi:hypothetical protein